jgi:hypothetical protein
MKPPLVADAARLIGRNHAIIWIYPRRQVPEPVTALPTSDRNLASRHHELQQLGDVAIVGPTRECPGLGTAICKIT